MKLWLVQRTDDPFYDVYAEFVCLAETEADALALDPGLAHGREAATREIPPSGRTDDLEWPPLHLRRVTYLGEAAPSLTLPSGQMVCAYYKHG